MAKITIKGDTSGEVNITVPAVAGNTTYNLTSGGGDLLSTNDVGDLNNLAKYDATTPNFTGTLQTGGVNVAKVGDNVSTFTNDSGFITGNQTITLSGDISGSGSTSINAQIGSGVVGTTELASTLNLSGKTVTYGSLPSANLTGALPAIDGSALTGVTSTNLIKAQVVYFSNSTVNGGGSYVNHSYQFRYATGMRISGVYNKQSSTSTLVVVHHITARNTSGNFHAMASWVDAGNTTALFRTTHIDPYYQSQNAGAHTFATSYTGLSAGNHTMYGAIGRGDTSSGTGVLNYNENSYDGLGINTNGYSMIYVMEVD